jgi:DNA-binding Lrp family transcriptional regulator
MTDELDDAIIRELKKDSRQSNVDIAKTVGLTEGAVRRRIQHLSDSGIIRRFTIELSAGKEISAVVMVKAKAETKRMMGEISQLGLARDAYEISGEYDACVILSGADMDEVDSKIDKIRGCKDVADTKTFLSFRRW